MAKRVIQSAIYMACGFYWSDVNFSIFFLLFFYEFVVSGKGLSLSLISAVKCGAVLINQFKT